MPKGKKKTAQAFDLFNALPDWIWVRDLDGRIFEVNEAAVTRLGYGREEILGKAISDFYFDIKDRPRSKEWSRKIAKEGSGYLVVTMRDEKGQPVEVEQHGRLVDWNGTPALLIVARDIGRQLRDSRMALTLYEAFRRSNDVMFYCDRNGTILDVNEAFTRHYGWSREEAVGQNPRVLRSRHSSNELYKRMWSSIIKEGHWRGEMINKAKDGREIPLILTITSVKNADGQIVGYISNAIDMTEHMALQARVADSEALASIGEMAAVVAHEIRNPLGSIVMAAKELASDELKGTDRSAIIGVLDNESRRLNETLTNFLSFARPRELKLERADLNGLLDEVVRMIQANPDLTAGAEIEMQASKELKPIPMDPDQIRQVIWNLAVNAVHAIGGRGKLTVRTGRDEGNHVYFAVSDTGPGLPEEIMRTLFKPFRTTKQKGTGLGLAIADRIVKAHGGMISVETGGQGTTFMVSLPSSEK